MKSPKIYGLVHSIESLGTLDGPGIRTVVFLQGCPNKCKFCHNVDCAIKKGGTEYTPERLVEKVLKNRSYWENYSDEQGGVRGGVTFSGGEPTYQTEFLLACVKLLKEEGVHVTVDSCVTTTFENIKKLTKYVDYWMVSIKQMDNEKHKYLTGTPNTGILNNIKKLDTELAKKKDGPKLRIRFVIIPTLTDSEDHINELGKYVKKLKSLDKIELLPYSTIGKHKWIELFGEYHLEGIREGNQDDVERVKKILSKYVKKF